MANGLAEVTADEGLPGVWLRRAAERGGMHREIQITTASQHLLAASMTF